MPVQNEAGPAILGREYQGWGMSTPEKIWGQKFKLGGLEPGGTNASFTPRSVSHLPADNRNLKLCSLSKFIPEPSAPCPCG